MFNHKDELESIDFTTDTDSHSSFSLFCIVFVAAACLFSLSPLIMVLAVSMTPNLEKSLEGCDLVQIDQMTGSI